MISTDGMAIPRIKQGFSFFIRGIAMPSVGSFRLHDSSIAICGTRLTPPRSSEVRRRIPPLGAAVWRGRWNDAVAQ